MPVVVILGLSSDIGRELAVRFDSDNWTVWGTYRNSEGIAKMPPGVISVFCDLTSQDAIKQAVVAFQLENLRWDLLIIAAGTEQPIGPFWDCDDDEWDGGIAINALAPLRFVRGLYPMRNQIGTPSVAFFSGSGTNNAAPAYSAYCVSKIMLIKMCELLDAESSDTSFFIVGPGIVRTKIHQQTLSEPERSGYNYQKVVHFLDSNNPGTGHDDIFDCLKWCYTTGKSVTGGRNISLVHDSWRDGGEDLALELRQDGQIYKLRRFGNELLFTKKS